MLKNLYKKIFYYKKNLAVIFKRHFLGNYVKGFFLDTKYGLFIVDIEDLGVGGALIKDGEYGGEEISRIKNLITKEANVLFVGAHVGALVIPISQYVKSVTAVEANPKTFELLRKNVLLNDVSNVKLLNIGANDKKSELDFVINRTNSGGSKRLPLIRSIDYFYDDPDVVKINSDRLDDILEEDFDLIVMDIEGSEYFALLGMKRILSKCKNLIIEFIPHHLKNVSGCTVAQLLNIIEIDFDYLYIPSRNLIINQPNFLKCLQDMYDKNQHDDGLIFSKSRYTLR